MEFSKIKGFWKSKANDTKHSDITNENNFLQIQGSNVNNPENLKKTTKNNNTVINNNLNSSWNNNEITSSTTTSRL